MEKEYTIKITDNQTDETETYDTDCLFAVIGNEEGCHEVLHLRCDGLATASLLDGVNDLLEKCKAKYAIEWIGAKMMKAEREVKAIKEGENDE